MTDCQIPRWNKMQLKITGKGNLLGVATVVFMKCKLKPDSLTSELDIFYGNSVSSDWPKKSHIENMDFEQTESNVHKMEVKVDSLTSELDIVHENCASSDLQKESDVENIDDEQAKSNVHKMQAKPDSLTSESDIVHEKTEEKTEEKQPTSEESKRETKKPSPKEVKELIDSMRFFRKTDYLMLERKDNPPLLVEIARQPDLDPKIMKVISLISIFLCEHTNGALLNSIYSHLKECLPDSEGNFTKEKVEHLMMSHPKIFKQTKFISPEMERKWNCISMTPETATIVKNKIKLKKKVPNKETATIVKKIKLKKKVPNKESALPGICL